MDFLNTIRYEERRRRVGKRILFIVMSVVGLLLILNNHLKHTIGDYFFQWIGVSPWTRGSDTGVHLPVVIGLTLLLVGGIGVVRVYRAQYPRIQSRFITACIVVIILFPIATEQFMFVVHRNSTGVASLDIVVRESRCQIRTQDDGIKANCSVSVFNYGNEAQLTLKPLFEPDLIHFQETTIPIDPRSRGIYSVEFQASSEQGGNTWRGFTRQGMEIQVRGDKKAFY